VSFLELGIDVGGKEVDFLHYKLAVPLREQFEETNFRQLLDYSPIPEVILDNSGAINKGNKAFWSLTNKDEDQLWHFLDMVQAESKEEVSNLLKVIFDEGKSKTLNHPIEVKLQNGKDGLTVLLYVNRIVSGKDLTAKLICSFIDITEHKKLEMHLAQSQKMQAVGQLAGGIAHDFNNLLTAMIGFCDLLLMRHPAGDQSFADIMQIKQNANRAANLVRQLLAFSRKQVLIPQIMDITGILAESSNLVRRLIGENIELIMNHGRDLRLVKVDQVQLEQVIINLAVNARDAMKNGGTLTIRTSNIDIDEHHPLSPKLISPVEEEEQIKPGEYVLLEVSDSGCGMSKDLVSKIFEPFFSTKEIGAGTGLGLSTVFGVVKQTEGYIYVTTEEGAGTTFSIFLKGYDNKELVSTTAHDQSDKISYTDLTGHGTILMVEDEAPVRIFAAHALTHKGYKVLEAEDGETALRIIAEKGASIDLIISDVIMPGMNGPAMIEKIYQQYPSIKVIFISGYAEDAFSETEGWDNKFNFLGKPFTLTQLASKVKEVMAKD
jgi:two-component system cell cycle sensor histidine kinase/response regulator CckA